MGLYFRALPKGWRMVLITLGLIVAGCSWLVGLRPLWIEVNFDRGQFRIGYFEESAGEVYLASDEETSRQDYPNWSLNQEGALTVPAGRTLVFPLKSGVEYSIQVTDEERPPYVVVGRGIPLPAGDNPEGRARPGERLVDAVEMDTAGGELVLQEWDPSRAWGLDRERLERVKRACSSDGDTPVLKVKVAGDQATFQLGRCHLVRALGEHPHPSLAVLAGPSGFSVAANPNLELDMKTRTSILLVMSGVAVLFVLLLFAGFGVAVTLVTGFVVALLPRYSALLAMDFAFSSLLLGYLFALWRLFRWRFPGPRWRPAAALTVTIFLGSLAGAGLMASRMNPLSLDSDLRETTDYCHVIGYSTIVGTSLRSRQGETVPAVLGTTCDLCRARTKKTGWSGAVFTRVRDFACNLPEPGPRHLVFLGASNDDLLWGVFGTNESATDFSRLIGLHRLLAGTVLGNWSPVVRQDQYVAMRRDLNLFAQATLERSDILAATVAEAVRCSRSSGADFLFLHDFLIWDMTGSRSPERTELMELRRNAVESQGGTFVDLLEETRNQVGVSWFNDLIHLSAVGHRHVADITCTRLEECGQ